MAETQPKRKRSEEQKWERKCHDEVKVKGHVNIGEAFQRWRDLKEVKGMKTNAEVAVFLLDRWVPIVLVLFTEPVVQYRFVQVVACDR